MTTFAFCSFAADKKDEAEKIIGDLAEKNCSVVSAGTLDGNEKLEKFGDARCFIAFLSKKYIDTKEISWLRMAINAGKPYLIYCLDDSLLPADLDITKGSEQQLRYDKNGQKERAALIEWLGKNGCRKNSTDIPDFSYTRDTEGHIILTNYNGKGGDVLIPRDYEGYPVYIIGKFAFMACNKITSVTIPDSVTSIEEAAFYVCRHLTSVTISDSVTSIGANAFWDCRRLTSVIIPDSVTSIGRGAFEECSRLTSVIIPNSVTYIGDWAFGSLMSEYLGFDRSKKLTIYCPENSEAWKYCIKEHIKHKPLSEYSPHTIPCKKSHSGLVAVAILLAMFAAVAGVQLSGLFDILGWLGGVFR